MNKNATLLSSKDILGFTTLNYNATLLLLINISGIHNIKAINVSGFATFHNNTTLLLHDYHH